MTENGEIMNRLILLTAIFLIACDQLIPFDVEGGDNRYLGCTSQNPVRSRNVVIDRANNSLRSEQYFISSTDFSVVQFGHIAVLEDNYDGSRYEWVQDLEPFSNAYVLHKTNLNLHVKQTYTSGSGSNTTRYNLTCTVYDDYQAFLKWERNVLDNLKNEAMRQKADKVEAEAAKKI
jgi:hypothetical protein